MIQKQINGFWHQSNLILLRLFFEFWTTWFFVMIPLSWHFGSSFFILNASQWLTKKSFLHLLDMKLYTSRSKFNTYKKPVYLSVCPKKNQEIKTNHTTKNIKTLWLFWLILAFQIVRAERARSKPPAGARISKGP